MTIVESKCVKSDVPSADEIDIPALKARYRQEREKRMRKDGSAQYADTADHLAHEAIEHDPFMPMVPRDAICEELDVAILGAGFSGLTAGFHLREMGVTDFRHIDHGGNFGGTWYWNRYPGIQCDNDAYCYLPLLEETGFIPTQKFSDGKEIYDYIQLMADKFDFRERALFHTTITGLEWDNSIMRWRITTNRDDEIRARFVIMCGGTLNTPKFPDISGLHSFKGHKFHTSRWDYDYTGGSWESPVLDKPADKRVAILGTGATAIQAVPYLGKYAKQLYVLQRTPSSVDERPNPKTDPNWADSLEPGWQAERQQNFLHAANEVLAPGEPDMIQDIWTEINRNLEAERAEAGEEAVPIEEFGKRREEMDFRVMERLRRRAASIVKDQDTAETLKPYYNFMCKRPLSNNDYYATFNRPNVTLLDVSDSQGLRQMTEKGFVVDGVEYEVDCMIFASGFEVTSDLKKRWGIDKIVGRRGVSIYDYWADGPRTLHGMMAHNFPNMFYTGYIQGGLNGTTTLMFRMQGYQAAYVISESLKRGIAAVEPSKEAEDAYIERFHEVELDLSHILESCPPSYFTNEGEKEAKWFLFRGWGLGWDNFQQMLAEWRDEGSMEGLVKDRETEPAE